MDILYLSIVFLVIVAIIWLKKPLSVVMMGGIAATIILFRVNLKDAVIVLGRQTVAQDTIDMLPSFHLIIFLQFMLEEKGRLVNAKDSFSRLLRDCRMNTTVSLAIMGLLPSAAVMIICADMVDRTCGEYTDDKNETFVSCYYRHISEMFLPIFPAILLGPTLSRQNAGVFVLTTIPMVVVVCPVVYVTHLKGISREMPPLEETTDRKAEIVNLVKNLWTLIAVLLIIIILNLSVCIAVPLVIAPNYTLDHFSLKDLPDLMVRSVKLILSGNMYLIMFFKGVLSYTGVIGLLLDFIGQFPIPMTMSFGLLFSIGAVTGGSRITTAPCMPMAFLAPPQGGIPFPVMLMSVVRVATQISPTHVCSFVVADFYHTTLGDIVARVPGSVIISSITVYGYGLLLGQIFYQWICKQKLMI